MIKAEISEKTISYGKQKYRVSSEGKWIVLMFGTFGPEDKGVPTFGWVPIPESKVPNNVKEVANEKK